MLEQEITVRTRIGQALTETIAALVAAGFDECQSCGDYYLSKRECPCLENDPAYNPQERLKNQQ